VKEAKAEGEKSCPVTNIKAKAEKKKRCSVGNMSPADRVSISQYDVAVVWRVDEPEAYYIIDTKFDLCMFVVSTVNGVSTTRVPCAPFIGTVEPIRSIYDAN
jgi:hypothetical protein